MSFPRYPAYKDSGVEWLGEVPEHWQIVKLALLSKSGMGQTILKEMLEDFPSDDCLPVYSASESDEIFGFFRNPSIRLDTGDLIIGARGSIGFVRKVNEPCTSTQTTIWIKRNTEALVSAFLYWYLTGNRERLFPFDKTAIPMLTVEQVRSGRIVVPPLVDQEAIACFLDRETAKIDVLVAEQERLIELLKEKRQAVISHAVTKGLDPSVPMKDSGVEWLGEVPAHWEIIPLIRVATQPNSCFIDGDWIESKDLSDGSIRYITTGNVGEGAYKEQGAGYIDDKKFDELRCTEVLPGDVLISRLNLPVGRACIAPDLGCRVVTSVDNVILRPDSSFDALFLVYLLSSKAHFFNMQTLARGTTMQRISRSELGRVRFAVPPYHEQRKIVSHLLKLVGEIEEMEAASLSVIDTLRERRSALISAAVTGQIDVRALASSGNDRNAMAAST